MLSTTPHAGDRTNTGHTKQDTQRRRKTISKDAPKHLAPPDEGLHLDLVFIHLLLKASKFTAIASSDADAEFSENLQVLFSQL